MPKLNQNKVNVYDCRYEDCKELEIVLEDYSWNVRLCDVERAYKLVSTVWNPKKFECLKDKNIATKKLGKINKAYSRLKKAATKLDQRGFDVCCVSPSKKCCVGINTPKIKES